MAYLLLFVRQMVKSPTSEMLITATLVALVAVAGLSLSTNQDPSSSSTLLPVVARSVHVSIQSKVSTTTKAGLLASNGPGRVVIGADPASTGEHAAQGTPGGAAMRNQFSKGKINFAGNFAFLLFLNQYSS